MKTRVKIRQLVILIVAIFSIVICLNACQPTNGEENENTKIGIAEDTSPEAHKHSWSSWEKVGAATCSESGSESRSCSCGKIESRITEALGHSEGEWVTDREATCTTDGSRSKKCSVCGIALITETINATGHKEGEWIVIKDATSSENGRKNLPCLLCGTVLKTEEIPPELAIYSIDEFSNGLALISTNKGYGYINTKGEIVIEPCYTTAGRFYTELARVKIEGKYGYINTNGELAIPAEYSSAPEKFDDLAIVEKDGATLVIDDFGNVVYTAGKNDVIGEYINRYFWVESSKETLSGTEYSMSYYNKWGGLVVEINNAKNAGIYSSPNEYGFAYVKEIIKKGSGLYTEQYEYALVNLIDSLNQGIVRQNISSVNGNHYFPSDGSMRYLTFDSSALNYRLNLCVSPEATLVYELNQTITPMCKDGVWQATAYLLTARGLWDGYFAQRAKRDVINEYYIDIQYILDSTGENIIVDFKNDYKELSGAKIKAVRSWIYEGKEYYCILLKNTNGTLFSTIMNPNKVLVCSAQNEFDLGYEKDTTINYRYYTYYYSYSGEADISELDWHFVIAKDTQSGLFGYVDINTGEWAINPQYQSVTDFRGEGAESVAVVNGNTIINTRGEVVFTIDN